MKTNQKIAALPTQAARMPSFDHGETEDSPNPAPNANKIRYKAAAVHAPPMTAPHDTPDECDSRVVDACTSGWDST
jgi:hypothetical protein